MDIFTVRIWRILLVSFIKIIGIMPEKYNKDCSNWYRFVSVNFSRVALVGVGIVFTNLEASLHAIKELGYASTVIASDLGQTVNPDWSDAMAEYIHYLKDSGLTSDMIDTVTKKNQENLLDI